MCSGRTRKDSGTDNDRTVQADGSIGQTVRLSEVYSPGSLQMGSGVEHIAVGGIWAGHGRKFTPKTSRELVIHSVFLSHPVQGVVGIGIADIHFLIFPKRVELCRSSSNVSFSDEGR